MKPRQIHATILLIVSMMFGGCSAISIQQTRISENQAPALRVVQISDIHYDSSDTRFLEMVEKINQINPDLLLITGDFLSQKRQFEPLLACLGKLTVTCPKYAILGNWEYWSHINISDFKTRLAELGITLLVNEAQVLNIRNRAVQIYGVDDYLGGKPNLKAFHALDNHLNILLAHCPIAFDALVKMDSANQGNKVVMLSGHTHGGQVTFFGVPFKTPVGSGEYSSGIYKKGNDVLYVSRGIGNSVIKFRLFSPPTIELLEM